MRIPALVQDMVDVWLHAIDAEAPGLVEGLYLTGSVAFGEFHPRSSDIDFVAVMRTPADPATVACLKRAHAVLKSRYARPNFEGICVTFDDLANRDSDPVTWRTLARHAITCRGPEPATLRILDDPAILARWTRGNLESYWRPLLVQASRFPSLWSLMAASGYRAVWIVLGISRLHSTLATCEICSKDEAGRYALRTFPDRWHRIIKESLRLREADMAAPDFASAFREIVTGGSLYRTPLSRRRDAIAFGTMVLSAVLHTQI